MAAEWQERAPECFHCGLPCPPEDKWRLEALGIERSFCCPGCYEVARAILSSGLSEYYTLRTERGSGAQGAVPEFLKKADLYDHPAVQEGIVTEGSDGDKEVSLLLEGIRCAACVWLNERHIADLPGVRSVKINYTTQRAYVRWDDTRIHLSDILKAVGEIGYIAHPYQPGAVQAVFDRQRRDLLHRFVIAGSFGMQVMTLALALYLGPSWGMSRGLFLIFEWLSAGLATPIVTYAAIPFFRGAWRDLKQGRTGMDLPIALGIGIAFTASMFDLIRGQGNIYFDSVSMFTTFLLLSRLFEDMARARTARSAQLLTHALPQDAVRLDTEGSEERVPVSLLAVGDRLLIRSGERIPADGVISDGASSVDESILTGEARPIPKRVGESVIAGSVNMESALVVLVQRVGRETVLSTIEGLLERAQRDKPRLTALAERTSAWFVGVLLLLAIATATTWAFVNPAHIIPATLAVLVIACPCALSLAIPTALTAATGALMRRGLVVTRSSALELLARARVVVFDKTGTLTEGHLSLVRIVPRADRTEGELLALACALEQRSEHPIAHALLAAQAAAPATDTKADAVLALPGEGLEGLVAGHRYRLGTRRFTEALSDPLQIEAEATEVWIADEHGPLGVFVFNDRLRPGVQALLQRLRHQGRRIAVLSGDRAATVDSLAQTLGIDEAYGDLLPEDKLAWIRKLSASGVVAMVGDGVNDAAALAAAPVAIAVGRRNVLAAASADLILLSGLTGLAESFRLVHRMRWVVRENLAWAILYNAVSLPAAALGLVPPWLAALGMSGSSLLVVLNALRLLVSGPGSQE